MYRMVSPLVTELEIIQDMLDESHWMEFARQRPGLCSISSTYTVKSHKSEGSWYALLPDESNPVLRSFRNSKLSP